jgi:hypothetical protein
MTRKSLRRLAASILLGIGAFSAFGFGGVVAARPAIDPATHVYTLHGTGPFSTSVATAIVTRLSAGRAHLSLTAEHLPSPTMLRAKFARHAYVAWLVSGTVMHGPLHMGAVRLAATHEAGSYFGEGAVTISGVTTVIITAEPTAQAYMPIMPCLMALVSAGHQN